MKRTSLAVLLWFLALLITCLFAGSGSAAQAQTPGRDDAFEQATYERLAKVNPDAVPIFQQATAALDADDFAAARRSFERVLVLAPDFPDALRRLSYAESALGDVQAGVQHARRARAVEDTPINQIAVARALLMTKEKNDANEAVTLAKAAMVAQPDDASGYEVLLIAGMATQDRDALRLASTRLIELSPDHPAAHYVAGLLAAEGSKWEQAEQELLLARDLGIPADVIQQALGSGIASQARLYRTLRYIAYTIGIWLVGMALLFIVGLLLSALTLAAVKRPPRTAEFRVNPVERIMRSLYAVVIALTSAYFYLSIPLLILIVVGGTVGLIYLMLQAPRISLQLLAIVAIVGFYTTVAIIRSVFTRIQEHEPGRLLPRSEAPRLWALAVEVARRVGTRPVDAIYVTPAVEVAVTERGGLSQKLRGTGQRCLILGLGTLPGMTQGEFKAILAHEYGHFSNRDTAGGNLARQVRASMYLMAYRLAQRGLARSYNPAWLFVNGFNRVFLRITLGASRLQEILADRYAAVAYGIRNFADGLTRIVRLDLAFDIQVNREVGLAAAHGRDLHNLYALAPVEASEERETLEKRLNEVMSRPTSAYDSHPAVRDRIRLLEPLAGVADIAGSQEPLDDLLPNLDALQYEMTALIQGNVAKQQAAYRAGRAAFERQEAKQSVPEVKPYREALAAAFESGDADAQAEALQELGGVYADRGLPQKALTCYREALTSYRDRNDQEGERVARFNIAMIHKALGELERAEEELLAVVSLDEATNSPDLASDRDELAQVQALRGEQAA